ncbi:MAG: ABC transporter substrate-binding protein [Acidimicrobiia bacterium]
MRRPTRTALVAALLALALAGAACGSDPKTSEAKGAVKPKLVEKVDLRLGYFPNVTHAAAVAGVEKGIYAEKLGENVNLKTATFNAGPAAVEALFAGALDATEFVNREPAEAQTLTNAGILRITGKAIPEPVIAGAWNNLPFTFDPVASSLHQGAEAAKSVGLLPGGTKLDGIYDLTLLTELLAASGQAPVKS